MNQYRKKPVVIEAVQFTGDRDSAQEILNWVNGFGGDAIWFFNHDAIQIKTLEGVMVAHQSDWIIKGVKGEFYPCKDDIFRTTYEAVS